MLFAVGHQGGGDMLRNMNDLEGYAVRATDGRIGHVRDCYFDDEAWVIRYFVVETGIWLSNRKVLILPIAASRPNRTRKVFPISITKEQVRNSPDIDTDKPVSRQHEVKYLGYYGQPTYWRMPQAVLTGVYPNAMLTDSNGGGGAKTSLPQVKLAELGTDAEPQNGDVHLRSAREVMGYHIEATDGDIGHVQGLLVDDVSWAIRYMIVDNSNWWLGHQVLVAPQWIQRVSWPGAIVSVTLTRQSVKDAPRYESSVPFDREQEIELYKHHESPSYWADEVKLQNPQFSVAPIAEVKTNP
jgi:uncharacterized protein YrrD